MTRLEREHAAVEARRQARHARVVALAGEGHSLREVARQVGISCGTVRRYLRAGQYQPCAKHTRRPHACDAFATYLRRRWEEGEHNSAALSVEIQQHGFRGAASTVRQYVRVWRTGPCHPGRRRRADDAAGTPPPRERRFSPRQTRWILVRPVDELDANEQNYRKALSQESPTIATAQALVEDFGRIVRARAHADSRRAWPRPSRVVLQNWSASRAACDVTLMRSPLPCARRIVKGRPRADRGCAVSVRVRFLSKGGKVVSNGP